jgi:hypothetical protein
MSLLKILGFESKIERERKLKQDREYSENLAVSMTKSCIEFMNNQNYWNENLDNYSPRTQESIKSIREKLKNIKPLLDNSEKLKFFEIGHTIGYEYGYNWGALGHEKLLSKEEYEKHEKRHKILNYLSLVFLLIGISAGVFLYFDSNHVRNSYQQGIKETKNFYQQNGVCPKDSTSKEFVQWKKLWEQKFSEK